jgi:tRNA(Ile)-lysidine synthase
MPSPGSTVDAELARGLAGLPDGAPLCVAYSGGRDSTVLLDACLRLAGGRPVRAIHVHHGLAAAADDWVRHCAAVCAGRGVPLAIRHVVVVPDGRGPEAAARAARYAACAASLGPGEYLVTAHHADDQLETVLLHLARGSGVAGLAGIPVLQPFAAGWLWRPLLAVPGAALAAAAAARGFVTVVDPANADPALDRSFLRTRAVPALRERFPHLARAAARSAALLAEAATLLDAVAAADATALGAESGRVPVAGLAALAPARQRNLLRHLAREAGLPVPPEATLRAGLPDLLGAAADRRPALRWPGAWLRRYRGSLRLLPDPGPEPGPGGDCRWDGRGPLDLGPWRGQLRLVPAAGGGLAAAHVSAGLAVRFRAGALRLRPAGDPHHRSLKFLCQSAGIVPWMRPHLPLLVATGGPLAGRVLAIADRWVAAEAAAPPGTAAVAVEWTGHPPVA